MDSLRHATRCMVSAEVFRRVRMSEVDTNGHLRRRLIPPPARRSSFLPVPVELSHVTPPRWAGPGMALGAHRSANRCTAGTLIATPLWPTALPSAPRGLPGACERRQIVAINHRPFRVAPTCRLCDYGASRFTNRPSIECREYCHRISCPVAARAWVRPFQCAHKRLDRWARRHAVANLDGPVIESCLRYPGLLRWSSQRQLGRRPDRVVPTG
jgi:hypothetical protein